MGLRIREWGALHFTSPLQWDHSADLLVTLFVALYLYLYHRAIPTAMKDLLASSLFAVLPLESLLASAHDFVPRFSSKEALHTTSDLASREAPAIALPLSSSF